MRLASVKSTFTMEGATSMEAFAVAAFVELLAIMEAFPTAETLVSAESIAIMPFASLAELVAVSKSVPVSIPAAPVIGARSAIVAAAVEPVKPRTRSYEHAPDKIIRAVVTVRRATVWRIPIIAIGAGRSRSDVGWRDVAWPESNPETNPNLRMGCARHYHANSEQYSIF
jgi:hypothetical protein